MLPAYYYFKHIGKCYQIKKITLCFVVKSQMVTHKLGTSFLYFSHSRGRNGLLCIVTQTSTLALHRDTEWCPLTQPYKLYTAFYLVFNFI